jgi:hypothetical protein
MFLHKLLHFFKSNIKRYQDEKQLEEFERNEFLSDLQKAPNPKDWEFWNKKLHENMYKTEKNFIKRIIKDLKFWEKGRNSSIK